MVVCIFLSLKTFDSLHFNQVLEYGDFFPPRNVYHIVAFVLQCNSSLFRPLCGLVRESKHMDLVWEGMRNSRKHFDTVFIVFKTKRETN